MKRKIDAFQAAIRLKGENRLKRLCGRLSPMKRRAVIRVIGVVFAVADIWFVASSICGVGKKDAEKEFLKLRHIETPELQQQKDSVPSMKNYELKMKRNEHE